MQNTNFQTFPHTYELILISLTDSLMNKSRIQSTLTWNRSILCTVRNIEWCLHHGQL